MLPLRFSMRLLAGLFLMLATATSQAQSISEHLGAPGLDEAVLQSAIEAVDCAERVGQPKAQRLAVIDYRLPSTERRLWVFDLNTRTLLFNEYVAHGRGSGEARASRFSNVAESYTTSLGLFRTLEAYDGANGYSLRLEGLEPGINDRALARNIVIHGADYVSPQFIRTTGRLGRSYGCPAVRREIARPLIDALRGNQYVYAYAGEPKWSGTPASLGCHQKKAPQWVTATQESEPGSQSIGVGFSH